MNTEIKKVTRDEEEFKVKVFKISELTRELRALVQERFGSIWVEGEISNLNVPSSGHTYFSLKDETSKVRCVLFKNARLKLKYIPEDGDQVLLSGNISFYEPSGQCQITVGKIEPLGRGILQKEFDQLKKKLLKEGLFSDDRKKPIPEFPWRVGIITSETGAALRDMLKVIKRRNSKVSILVHPVAVQGEGAGKEIVDAIHNMNEYQGIDVLIIGRGGGSVEDLWAFNEEIVARAITVSKIPIVSAVGHEVDYTISDFVADKRASTPSVAAELVVPILLDEAFKEIFGLSKQLLISMKSKVSTKRDRLRLLMNRKFFLKPEDIYLTREQKRDDLERRLELAYEKCKMIHDKKRQKIIAIVVISIIFVAYLLWKLIA